MAVVAEFKTSKGVTIRILDDAYKDKTPEELARIRREAQVTAWRIAEAKARRALQKKGDQDGHSQAGEGGHGVP